MLGILSKEEYKVLKELTKRISEVSNRSWLKGLELYDIKLEFGRVKPENSIVLIDEISGGNMRAYKDGKYIEPLTLEKIMLED